MIPGVKIGQKFSAKAALRVVGVHGAMQGGIDGFGSKPAYSICVSGEYAHNDGDEEFTYTGTCVHRLISTIHICMSVIICMYATLYVLESANLYLI
jgi:hypothetical protein